MTIVYAVGCKKEQKAKVETSEVTNVTSSTVMAGGIVVSEGSSAVYERGVCWCDDELGHAAPDVNTFRVPAGEGIGSFQCEITGLLPEQTYRVRAYAIDDAGVTYGDHVVFTTIADEGGIGTFSGHDYVDLGLPSGTLWATCNVGADSPEGYGDYFAWGETQSKYTYDDNSYKYNYGGYLTKYCTISYSGYDGFTDNLTKLQADDDAATANWGNGWRTPTNAEWQELCDNTTSTWMTKNGVKGRLFTASNRNSLFLPAAGSIWNENNNYEGYDGRYWSCSLYANSPGNAWEFCFTSDNYSVQDNGRWVGESVRPVRSMN